MRSILLQLDSGRTYTEREINAELVRWGREVAPAIRTDHVTLRRLLVDHGHLERTRDGHAYRVGFPPGSLAFDLEIFDLDLDEKDDEKKRVYHLQEAAIRGHPCARHNLGCHEERNGTVERAVKHYIIAANLGLDQSMQRLKGFYKEGAISKDNFAAALRAHKAAVNATKSPQRDAAAKFHAKYIPNLQK